MLLELKLYTVKEVSKILQIHKKQIYDKISKGEIKAVRLGSGLAPPIRIKHSDLIEYINGG